jgi:uncharacterized LabA/DUF88 family protein
VSKNVAMFVDVANMYYAARGQDVDVDYVALLKHATKGRDLIRAYAYTGLDPENENQRKFIDFLAKNGYKPVVKDIRKFGDGRMKANLDIELVVDLFRLSDRMDIAVIVSGDGDFAPAIRALQDTGVRCEVVSFKPNTSSDLIAVADEFTDIMKIASISRKERATSGRATGMSAPEMPAKEVTPEFGFREASPAVAAAALAALKTGGPATNGRRTRGGSRRGAAPSEEPPGETLPAAAATTTDPSAESSEEGKRRRRRRGGRGRGRSRRDETTPVTAAGSGTEEVGWEEFDDIKQLDGLEAEREYTFEEADAATLAELGIDPSDVAPSEAATDEKPKRRTRSTAKAADGDAEKPKSRARRSTTKPAADVTADTDAEAEVAEKPKGRTRTTTKAGSDAAPKSKPRTRGSTAKSATNPAEPAATSDSSAQPSGGGDEPQGIWGRFRSARGPRPTPTS